MRASLEVRAPFLNRKLVEALSQMDQRSFIAFGQKSVLRRILGRYLPRDVFDRPKKGFIYPQRVFLDNFNSAPSLPMVPDSRVNEVWAKRDMKGWQRMAVRLAILSKFVAGREPG